jgi:phenylpropionate dioxygenase-like ring-hydroxylating dioxygenase large terminal subunit
MPALAASSPTLDDMLDAAGDDLARGALPLWIYNHPDLYQRELEQIFSKGWNFMALECEVPNAGDYVRRSIGNDMFIVVRGADGEVRVLLDSCRHRGAQVCFGDRGNSRRFVCPYHGWVYDSTGALVAVPNKEQAYQHLTLENWGLMPASRIETYRGLIFASLVAQGGSLAEHLGDYRWYLDLNLGLAEGGMQLVGPPHRWRIDADWKSGSENFAGDSYHTQTLHRSIVTGGLSSRQAAGASGGRNDIHVTECNGHTTSIRRVDEGQVHFWGYPEEIYSRFRSEGLTPEQFDLARRSVSHTGTIFPNLSLIHIAATGDPNRDNVAYFSLRQWKPTGPGQMEAWSWVLVPKGASEEYGQKAYRAAVATFSPSGNFEQDDSIVWSGIARNAAGVFAQSSGMRLNYEMGLASMGGAEVINDWPGPGTVYDSNLEEGVQRTFFRHWFRSLGREVRHGL